MDERKHLRPTLRVALFPRGAAAGLMLCTPCCFTDIYTMQNMRFWSPRNDALMTRQSSSKWWTIAKVVYWTTTSALLAMHVVLILNSASIMNSDVVRTTTTTTTTTMMMMPPVVTTTAANANAIVAANGTADSTTERGRRDDDYDDDDDDDDRAMQSTTVMPDDPRMYLIHVGKAGGTTLVRALGLERTRDSVRCMAAAESAVASARNGSIVERDVDGGGEEEEAKRADAVVDDIRERSRRHDDDCYRRRDGRGGTIISSQIEERTLGYYHMWGPGLTDTERTWLMENTNAFVYTVREPIDRLISAYNFHKQLYHVGDGANVYPRFYDHCFPNAKFDDVIRAIRVGPISEGCRRLGMDVLLGRLFHGGGRHFRFNYSYYVNRTIEMHPDRPWAVIRTSELWEDVSALDRALGGDGNFDDRRDTRHRHGSDAYAVPYDARLEDDNARYLCCLIYADMEAYQRLILGAANLDDVQKSETLVRSFRRCRIDARHRAYVDPVRRPFSWRRYRRGRTCIGLVDEQRT